MTTPAEYREMADEMYRLGAACIKDGLNYMGEQWLNTAAALREAAELVERDTRTVAEIIQAVEDARLKWYGRDAVRDATRYILLRLWLEEETP